MAHLVQPSLRKPRRGYLESMIAARAILALSAVMDSGYFALLGPGMTGGVL
jgi:hypothetical protein